MGCVNHQERDARFTCSRCRRAFCVECVTWSEGRLLCHDCQEGAGPQPQGGPSGPGTGPAWEKRDSLFDIDAIFATVREVLLRPTATFSSMRTEGGLSGPLAYAVLLGTIGTLFSLLWEPVQFSIFRGIGPLGSGAPHVPPAALVAVAVLSPLFIAAGLFVSAGLTHLALMVLGWARSPFETTFRVYCYTHGSLALLQVIPICGGIVALFWSAIIYALGVAAVQRITFGRAALAMALPFLACCGCAGALLAAVIGGMHGALSPVALSFGCPFHALTGLPCPTCGGTRAVMALATLHWREAFLLNPLVFLAATTGPVVVGATRVFNRNRSAVEMAERILGTRTGRILSVAAVAANWAHLILTGR